jgi:hypothetical protein
LSNQERWVHAIHTILPLLQHTRGCLESPSSEQAVVVGRSSSLSIPHQCPSFAAHKRVPASTVVFGCSSSLSIPYRKVRICGYGSIWRLWLYQWPATSLWIPAPRVYGLFHERERNTDRRKWPSTSMPLKKLTRSIETKNVICRQKFQIGRNTPKHGPEGITAEKKPLLFMCSWFLHR